MKKLEQAAGVAPSKDELKAERREVEREFSAGGGI